MCVSDWGGRMLGSVCNDGVNYTGIEPYSKTFNGLVNIKRELDLTDDRVKLYNDTAENVLPTLYPCYNLALTSPFTIWKYIQTKIPITSLWNL